jgi:hypothetical protein
MVLAVGACLWQAAASSGHTSSGQSAEGMEERRQRGGRHLLVLQRGLGLREAVDEDGEDDVHHDEARKEGPRDEVGRDAYLLSQSSSCHALATRI